MLKLAGPKHESRLGKIVNSVKSWGMGGHLPSEKPSKLDTLT
jgi:hypothetical protein